jgi:hypothetical protein
MFLENTLQLRWFLVSFKAKLTPFIEIWYRHLRLQAHYHSPGTNHTSASDGSLILPSRTQFRVSG